MFTLWTIAQHEIARARRHRTFRTSLLLVTCLLAVAFALEAQRQAGDARSRSALQARVTEAFKAQPDRHPHRMAHYGSFAFYAPSALAAFDPGITPFTGNSVYLEAHKRNLPNFSAALQASELVRFGRPTAAFVLQLLLPLLIFVLTFDSIAAERESGTWRLALSQGVPARSLVLGKLLGSLTIVLVFCAPALSLASILQLGLSWPLASGDTWLRYGSLALAYGVYLAMCTALGVIVSSLHRSARAALSTLLCIWIAGWVVAPRVATELAVRVYPVPARAEMEAELVRSAIGVDNGHGRDSPEAKALTQRTLEKYGVSRIEDLPINIHGLRAHAGEQRTGRLYDRSYARVYEQQRAQEAFVLRCGVAAPVLLLRSLSMALAGSDAHGYADFLEQAEAHRAAFIARLNDVHAQHLRYAEHDNTQRASHAHWQSYETFEHVHAPLSRSSPLLPLSAAGLLTWCLAVLGLALIAARWEPERS